MVAVSLKKKKKEIFFFFFFFFFVFFFFFFFQAEDGIRGVERSRGLGDVYKRQIQHAAESVILRWIINRYKTPFNHWCKVVGICLLYTSDAADE